jgi:hypothetical protein
MRRNNTVQYSTVLYCNEREHQICARHGGRLAAEVGIYQSLQGVEWNKKEG